ncbi:hypothetical protein ACLKA6_012090 [Drosophila palustris]
MLELLNRPHADPYKFPLTDGFLPVLLVVGAYLYFVLSLGRQFMFQRQPCDLKNVLKIYNLAQVIYNGSMFIVATYYLVWVQSYNLSCLVVRPLDYPQRMLERLLCYTYYINKYVDLLDTIFIVLRKNYKQISVLHLVHHVYMTVGGYFYIRFNGYGGHGIVLGYLNVLVHFVMYGYYYYSSQYPHMKQSLWWKKASSTTAEKFWVLTLTCLRHPRARTLNVGVVEAKRHLDECCLLSLGFGV